jgi:transcriptional regulator with XRE-family HTH domain
MLPDEKQAFAERLKLALTRCSRKIDTAVELALQFNLRHPNDPITPQAAHKWLTGKARPTLDKIATLAEWLNVSPHWLRHGPQDVSEHLNAHSARQSTTQNSKTEPLTDAEIQLIIRLRALSDHQKQLIAELVEQLALEREAWPK